MDDTLRTLLAGLSDAQVAQLVAGMPEHVAAALTSGTQTGTASTKIPKGPLEQAIELDPGVRRRPHLTYLSDRLAQAMRDVEAGRNRMLAVSMPPRTGKSHLASTYLPVWVLRKHPDWPVVLLSHSPHLATGWGRQVRREIEQHGDLLRLEVARDAGAVSEWETTAGGGVLSRSVGQSVTGYGARVIVIDDAVKDYAAAHSQTSRDAVWDWYRANVLTRLQPPWLLLLLGTRWHQDDLIGRALDADDGRFERIVFPAVATGEDVLGRAPGDPLLSPLVEETRDEAAARWREVEGQVGSYVWDALYQQDPTPSGGAIFDVARFRYWTDDPGLATGDGTVIHIDPGSFAAGVWVDSWDTSFKGSATADYVVGQRWVKLGARRFLVAQQRGRWSFTEALAGMRAWADGSSPGGAWVTTRLVEDSANGPAIIDTLKDEVAGIVAVRADRSKEARYRAVLPEIERGEVFLPLPSMAGFGWVGGLVGELREAPHGRNDDQCLIGATLVETPDGPVRLMDVRTGDVVLGASGWVRVLAAACTGSARVIGSAGLVGTAGHPVWTSRGWSPLASLRYDDELWIHARSRLLGGGRVGVRGGTGTRWSSTLRRSALARRSGTGPMRAGSGTASTPTGRFRGRVPVFNLATGDGTYFANGVLVHNCDALAQALLWFGGVGGGGVTVPGGFVGRPGVGAWVGSRRGGAVLPAGVRWRPSPT